jgi:hypothetical protein
MILKGRFIKVHDVVHGASCGGRHALGRYQMWTSWKHETSFKNICGCDAQGTFNKLHLIKRRLDHQSEVLFGTTSLMKILYKKKLKGLKIQLQKVFFKRYIILNKLAYGIIIFFVHKKDGILKMCVDYKAFNKVNFFLCIIFFVYMTCLINFWGPKYLPWRTCI